MSKERLWRSLVCGVEWKKKLNDIKNGVRSEETVS